ERPLSSRIRARGRPVDSGETGGAENGNYFFVLPLLREPLAPAGAQAALRRGGALPVLRRGDAGRAPADRRRHDPARLFRAPVGAGSAARRDRSAAGRLGLATSSPGRRPGTPQGSSAALPPGLRR